MRLHRTGLLVIATATLGLSAPTAHADTLYAGAALYKGTSPAGPSLSLLRRDSGAIVARAVVSASCRGYGNYSQVVRLSGSTPDGVNFSASGRTRIGGRGPYVRVEISGTLAADSASGTANVRHPCRRYTNPFSLRTESAPAGAPAVPGPGTLMVGMTSQAASGLRLPVTLRVAKNGRVYASWQSMVRCGRANLPVWDITPSRKIGADGSFGGSQRYTIRYRGFSERYRVSFRGRFHADGASGTYTVSMRYRDGNRRFTPCRSGRQSWTARP